MLTKTTYKVVVHNGVEYLQYLKTYRLFFFFKRTKWLLIPYPNDYNKRQIICSQLDEYVSVKKFIIKYPDIDLYFKTEYVERKNKFKKS